MHSFTVGKKEYTVAFGMVAFVRAHRLTGKSFREVANANPQHSEGEQVEAAFERLLLGLQQYHGQQFQSVEDVAALFDAEGTFQDFLACGPAFEVMQAALEEYMRIDKSVQPPPQNGEVKKKKRRGPKTNTPPAAKSTSDSDPKSP